MNKTFLNTTISLCLIGLVAFTACEEAAIPVDNDGTPMKLDTVSFPVVKVVSYQTPPELGKADRLYFGKENGYDFKYNLIKIDRSSITSGTNFRFYNDTLVTVDSLALTLQLEQDSIGTNAEFQLRYFPNGSDSVFAELGTNYLNFDRNMASEVISTASLEADTSDTSQTKVFLNFSIDKSVIDAFRDSTVEDFNRSFLVEMKDISDQSFKFFSVNATDASLPLFKVFYRLFQSDTVVIDTVTRSYRAIEDLTVAVPPALVQEDTTRLTISGGMGLKAIAFVDMEGWTLPEKATISSADLIFHRIQGDSIEKYTMISYPLNVDAEFNFFQSFASDPYDVDVNFHTSTNLFQDKFRINHRKNISNVGKGKFTHRGYKLYSSLFNDPFQKIYLHGLDHAEYFPVVRVKYVVP